MEINDLVGNVGQWMTGGEDADVVISSRTRIARNIGGFPFLTRISSGQRHELEELLRRTILEAPFGRGMTYVPLTATEPLDRFLLVERHLISHELANGEGDRGVAFDDAETLSIMVNEEDHLRMQSLRTGLQLGAAWTALSAIDDAIGERLNYAFRPDFGYLTACPTNVGTGMRVSVMLHLPGLVMSRHLEKVFNAMAKLDMIVRGLYGEGTEAVGDLYQISNQKTLGKSEQDIITELQSVTPQIVSYERRVREAMMRENRRQLEDQIFRAEGILHGARMISSDETLYLLSRLRLGLNLGIIGNVDIGTINRLLIATRPAHLQKMVGCELSREERHAIRADYVRKVLAGEEFEARGLGVFDERFTEHARRSLAIAREEAVRRGSIEVCSEHVLLGLLQGGEDAPGNVARLLGEKAGAVRDELTRALEQSATGESGRLAPFSRHAIRALRYALEESQAMGHRHVGTEHILLGLLREDESVAAKALNKVGLVFADVRREVLRRLGGSDDAGPGGNDADVCGPRPQEKD